ncbi:MAG TPA: T9SS type A sorting domain-containing protein [Mucilaginibacter sp.]
MKIRILFFLMVFGIILTPWAGKIYAQAPNFSYSPSTNVYTVGTAIPTLSPVTNSGGGAVIPFAYGTPQVVGTASNGLNNPYGLGIDPSGNIYAVNYYSGSKQVGAVSKYTPSSGSWGLFTNTLVQNPTGIAFDQSGNAYVLNYIKANNGNGNGNGNVTQYNPFGVYGSTVINSLGASADGIIIDPFNNLYIAQGSGSGGNATVTQFNISNGLPAFSLPNTHIANPAGVATDGSGNIYVLDATNKNVVEYNSTGTYISSFVVSLNNALAIYADGAGNIYIGDTGAKTVTVYSNKGTKLTTLTATNGIGDPRGLVTDKQGNLYVSDYSANTVTEYPAVGGYSLSPTLPPGLSFDSQTGVFSGTPTTGFPSTIYYITGYNSFGSYTATVTLSCPNSSAPTISYNPSINIFTTTVAITPLNPSTTGSPNSFSISPSFPTNGTLSFNPSTGVFSGTPANTSAAAVYTVTCDNSSNPLITGSTTISIACIVDNYWTGKSSSDWNFPNNWNTKNVPMTATDLASVGVVPYNGKPSPIVSANTTAYYVTLGAAGNITVNNGAILTIVDNLTVNNNATAALQSTVAPAGNVNISPTALVNINGTGALTIQSPLTFTLKSDATGSGQVSSITSGLITGQVSVERYLTGSTTTNAYRGYRLLSSPVYANTIGGNNVYSINYVAASTPTTGTAGIPGGFDAPGNPTFFLYRDNIAPSNSSFTSGNFRGVADISASPSYTIDNDGAGFNIPVGNGFEFFDRGSKANLATKFITGTIADPVTLTATGSLNIGSITVHPWFMPSSGNLDYAATSVQGFTLVGNPYASSINWDNADATNPAAPIYAPHVSPYIYIWDATHQNYNVYAYGLGMNGVGTYGSNSNIIPSGQGFFVQATSAAASLTFNETAKTSSQANATNHDLYLGTPVQTQIAQYLNLIFGKDDINDINKDGTLICFKSNANPKYDIAEDALYKQGSGTVSLSTTSTDNFALAINVLPLPDQKPLRIPITVNGTLDGVYTLNLAAIKSVPNLYDVWLMDAYKKDSTDLRHNPVYSLNITNSIAGTHGSGRFTLVIRQNATKGVQLLSFAATKTTGGSQVIWTTINEQNYTYFTVERSTDGGATFYVSGSITSNELGTYSYLDSNPVIGSDSYRLKLVDINGTVSYSQIITLNYSNSNTNNNIVVYPNPVGSTINLSIVQISDLSTKQPLFGIKVRNILGAVVKNGTTKTFAWQENANNLLPGTYIIQVVNNSNNSLVGKTTFIKL